MSLLPLVLSIASIAASTSASGVNDSGPGMYSAAASRIGNDSVIRSPDGQSFASARFVKRNDPEDDGHYVISVGGSIGSLHIDIGPATLWEVLWAPDSKALFVTAGDISAGDGPYRVIVFERLRGYLRARNLAPLIYQAFGEPVKCEVREPPNVGGIGWLASSRHLLVAAEVVNHSVCDSFGTFKAYEVDPMTMKILQTYDQLEAKKKFRGLLGYEIVNAPDSCVRHPTSCYLKHNHPDMAGLRE